MNVILQIYKQKEKLMLLNKEEVTEACKKIANMYDGKFEIFSSKNGLFNIFKYSGAEGTHVDGYRQILVDNKLIPIASNIKHPNGNTTQIKNGVSLLYKHQNSGLKV